MKWATNISPLFFLILCICLRLRAIQCELTISQFYCNNTWNPEIAANSKTIVKSLCNLNLQLSFIETDDDDNTNNKSSSSSSSSSSSVYNGQQLTVDLLVTSGFETLRATSISGVDYWTVATFTTHINLDSNNDTLDIPLNDLKMQLPSICGQTFLIARVIQLNGTTVDQSIPIELKCLEKSCDLALYGETKDVYDMYQLRPVIPTTGQPIPYFIPEFKLWIKNNMPNETFSSRTGPSVYVVSAYIKSQMFNMFQYSIGNKSAVTVAVSKDGELDYELGDVMLHKGNRLVPSHGGRGTPSMPSGYQVALELDQLVLHSQKVCGNGLMVVKLSVPHSPPDFNMSNNYYLIPVFVDCWGHRSNDRQTVETCKVIPNYYDGGQTAWITYTIPGQTKIFEYKSEERSVRPVHVENERSALQDVALMKLTTDVQSDRLQQIEQCVDTVSGGSDTFVASLEVLLSGVEKSWAEMKPENDIQKVEHDKISLILATVSEVLTLALQLKNPLNGWLHIPFYLAFSSEGHIWEDENLATNQVSRKMKREVVDEFGDESGDNEIEEFGGNEEEEELSDDTDGSEGVDEYGYGVNGTTNEDGSAIQRRLRRAAEGTTGTAGRTTTSAPQQRSGGSITSNITENAAPRSTSPSSRTGSGEAQVTSGTSGRPMTTTATKMDGTIKQGLTGSQPSSGFTTPRTPSITAGTSQSGSTGTDRKMGGGSSSTTPSSTGAGATTGSPVASSRMGPTASGTGATTGLPVSSSRMTPTSPGTTTRGGSSSSGTTQRFARLEATTSSSSTSSKSSGSTSTAGTGPTRSIPSMTSGFSGTTRRMPTGTSRFNIQTTVAGSTVVSGISGSTQVGTESSIEFDYSSTFMTTSSSTEPNDTPYFGRKPLWHQDVSKILYGIIKYDSSFLKPYLAPDRIEAISYFSQTLFYGRNEDLNKFSYIPKSTLGNLTNLLKMVLSSSMPRIFDDIPRPFYELIMKWYNSELLNKSAQVTGCTFRSGLEMFLNATERMQMTKEWQNRKDQMTIYGNILKTLLQDDHPEYLAELYGKIVAAWSRNDAWMIRDGVPIHEPDVDDVCKRYTAAKLWQLEMPPVSKFAGRTVSPDHYKSVFWTEDRGTIYRGDRSSMTGQVFWSKVATCSCATENACGGNGGNGAGSQPSTTSTPLLSVTSSNQWTDWSTASLPMTSGQVTRDEEDLMSAAPVYRYHDQFQIKDQHPNKREEEEEFEIHEDLLFSD